MYYIVGQNVVNELVGIYPNLDLIGIRSPNQPNLGNNCKGNILQLRFDDINWKPFATYIPPRFDDIDKVIKFSKLPSKGVIAHCAAGKSRSVAMMMCYLIASGKANVEDIVDKINDIVKETVHLGFREESNTIYPNARIICMFDIHMGLDYKLVSSVRNHLDKWETNSTLQDLYDSLWEEYNEI